MSYPAKDETRINAILSADIITRGIATKAQNEPGENSLEDCNMVRTRKVCYEEEEYNSSSAFLLKNAYCIIVKNDGSIDGKILELTRFLEQIAMFSKVKLYENQTGVNFLTIFEKLTHDPHELEEYDGLICFVLCENEATLKRETPESVQNLQGAVSMLMKSAQLDNKPKLFFVEEVMKTKKQSLPPLLTEVGNEFLLVHELRSTLSNEGLLPKLPEIFREFSDRQNIQAMLARRSHSTISTQVCSLSKPVLFANCYCTRTQTDQ